MGMSGGANHDLPWPRLNGDFGRFKHLTLGKTIVMGRKTFELVGLLPGRETIVMSRNPSSVDHGLVAISIEEAYNMANHEVFVAGGPEIFSLAFEDIERRLANESHTFFATEVDGIYPDATAHLPELSSRWNETERSYNPPERDGSPGYDFVDYDFQ